MDLKCNFSNHHVAYASEAHNGKVRIQPLTFKKKKEWSFKMKL